MSRDLTRYQFECNIEQVDGTQVVEVLAENAMDAVDQYHLGNFEIIEEALRVQQVSLLPETIRTGHLIPLRPRRIFVCSPYQATDKHSIADHEAMARESCRYVFQQGHVPFAPHLLYPQILDESDPIQRNRGIEAGKAFLPFCHEVWVFGRKPGEESQGMKSELIEARMRYGKPVKHIRAPF